MDLATKGKNQASIKWEHALSLPTFCLIFWVMWQKFNAPVGIASNQLILHTWKGYRDILYVFFAMMMGGIFLVRLKKKTINPGSLEVLSKRLLPIIVLNIIGITFSYAVGVLIVDVSMAVGLLFNLP